MADSLPDYDLLLYLLLKRSLKRPPSEQGEFFRQTADKSPEDRQCVRKACRDGLVREVFRDEFVGGWEYMETHFVGYEITELGEEYVWQYREKHTSGSGPCHYTAPGRNVETLAESEPIASAESELADVGYSGPTKRAKADQETTDELVLSCLETYHELELDGTYNREKKPLGTRELARELSTPSREVDPKRVSDSMKKFFGGQKAYASSVHSGYFREKLQKLRDEVPIWQAPN